MYGNMWSSESASHPGKETGKGMNRIQGKGQLAHHFWGTSLCSIVVGFDSPEHAQDAMVVLNQGLDTEVPWKVGRDPSYLVWGGGSKDLAKCKGILARFGADPDKVDSMAKSIDYGEPFEVTIPVVCEEQGCLF